MKMFQACIFSLSLFVIAPINGWAKPSPPNILFFLVDDMGWQDTSEPFYYDADGKVVVTDLNR